MPSPPLWRMTHCFQSFLDSQPHWSGLISPSVLWDSWTPGSSAVTQLVTLTCQSFQGFKGSTRARSPFRANKHEDFFQKCNSCVWKEAKLTQRGSEKQRDTKGWVQDAERHGTKHGAPPSPPNVVIHVSKNDRLRLQNVESKTNQWHDGGDDPIRGLYPWLPHKVTRTVIKYDIMRNMNRFRWLFALLSVRLWVCFPPRAQQLLSCVRNFPSCSNCDLTLTGALALPRCFHSSKPRFPVSSECCYSQPPDEEQGPQLTHRCCDTFRIWRKWIDSLRAHERSGLCSLSLRFYSLNFWFRFSTSAFQNETRRRMIQSWQNTDL